MCTNSPTLSCERPPRRPSGRRSPFTRGRIAALIFIGLLSPLQRGTAAKRQGVAHTQRVAVVTGGMNAEFTVSDQERSIGFYHEVLGLDAPTARYNPALPGVGQLTG